jgi:hypothetical protein
MTLMKTCKTTVRSKIKAKPLYLKRTFTIYRKYRNHKRFVHPDLL